MNVANGRSPAARWRALSLCALLALHHGAGAMGTYEEPRAFIQRVYAGAPPQVSKLWLRGALRKDYKRIMGHAPSVLRMRYWDDGARTAWILREIGKERPITVGIVVRDGRIESMRVLIFRESRGGEVRHPFFTDQFNGASLRESDARLSTPIDGITGATLSVRALTKTARLALHLHGHVRAQGGVLP